MSSWKPISSAAPPRAIRRRPVRPPAPSFRAASRRCLTRPTGPRTTTLPAPKRSKRRSLPCCPNARLRACRPQKRHAGLQQRRSGAPISASAGHLLVIVGFTDTGDVVVNDPAATTRAGVRRTYDRGQFEDGWIPTSGGTVYVITDDAHPLPANSPGSW